MELGNYKIKVTTEAESREAQELFFELGYGWASRGKTYNDMIQIGDYIFLTDCDLLNYGLGLGREELTIPQLRDLVSAHRKPTEQGLISGADALRALADGKEVEYLYGDRWLSVVGEQVLITAITNDKFKFRLKPRTITLSVEIPAPFKPKEGDVFYAIAPTAVGGYSEMHITDQKRMDDYAKLGAWRTEDEIKQVVAALSGALKNG